MSTAGYAAGSVWSKLTFSNVDTISDTDEGRLARAKNFLDKNDLRSAVKEISSLKDKRSQSIAKDWRKDAMNRLLLLQAVKAIRAHITTLSLSVS